MSELNWWDLLTRHWGKLAGTVGGLVFALLVVKFGFWNGLFIVLCIAVGLYLGWRIDEHQGLRSLLEKLIPPKEHY